MTLKNFLKQILLYSFIVLIFISNYSCSGSCCSSDNKTDVPSQVLKKSDSFIKSRTGDEFFEKYISPDFQLTKNTPPYYEMVYKFSIPEKVYANGLIKFTVDSSGNVMTNRDIIGIPNCYRSEDECTFKIDKKWAKQIAIEKGLEQGIKDWSIEFIWNPQRDRYVWHVRSISQEIDGEIGYRAEGDEMLISPANGEVILKDKWRIN